MKRVRGRSGSALGGCARSPQRLCLIMTKAFAQRASRARQ